MIYFSAARPAGPSLRLIQRLDDHKMREGGACHSVGERSSQPRVDFVKWTLRGLHIEVN